MYINIWYACLYFLSPSWIYLAYCAQVFRKNLVQFCPIHPEDLFSSHPWNLLGDLTTPAPQIFNWIYVWTLDRCIHNMWTMLRFICLFMVPSIKCTTPSPGAENEALSNIIVHRIHRRIQICIHSEIRPVTNLSRLPEHGLIIFYFKLNLTYPNLTR